MTWLVPSVIATLASTLVLSGTYFYLYSHDRQRFLLIWGFGWLTHASRDVFTLLELAHHPLFNPTLLFIANQLTALISGILLLWGTYMFMRRSFPRAWLFFTLADACWIVIGSRLNLSFSAQTLPTYFFLGFVYIWTGTVILRHQARGVGRNLTGCAFILWGFHKLNYPFLRLTPWFAPWGYLLTATIVISLAIGIILIYFESTREALAKSEERYDLAVRGSSDGIWDWEEVPGAAPWCSPRIYEMLGYVPGEITGGISSWMELIHPDDRERIVRTLGGDPGRLEAVDLELRLRTKERKYRWFRARGRTVPDRAKHRRMAGTLQDITELRHAQDQLRMALFSIEKTALEIFWITDSAHFIYVNEYACRSLGYSREELLHCTVFDVDPNFTREMWDQHWETLRNKGSVSVQTRHRRKDGTTFPVEVTANFHVYEGRGYNFAYAKDISERHKAEEEKLRLEEQIRRAQKMEALGTLAGGIAHDFNNILGVILGYTEMVKDDSPQGSATRSDLEKVLAAGYRARDLVQQILAFSRQAPVEKIPLNPGTVIKEALILLRASLPASIAIHEDIASDCGMICADPIQLHQIMMNLGTNALHAMEKSGGILRVEMKTADSPPALQTDVAPAQQFVRLTVEDSGCGISPEITDKIFDPFFTTKELGKGTGMGLSIVYGIVHDYGGAITVDSRPGKGTAFHVFFPCCDLSETRRAPAAFPVPTEQGLLAVDQKAKIPRSVVS